MTMRKKLFLAGGGFKIEIVTTEVNQTFTLPLVNPTDIVTVEGRDASAYGYNFIVSWGDGSYNTITSYNDANITHTYTTAGTYDIEIKGRCDGWSFKNTGSSKDLVTKILNWGGSGFYGFCYLDNGFRGCSKLTTLPEGQSIKERLSLLSLKGCFLDCNILAAIPAGLFDNNINVTDFSYCFYRCYALQSIPVGLFDNNINVTTFSYCFTNCTSLRTIPSHLFYNNALVIKYGNCFNGCNKLQITSDIFNYANFLNKNIVISNCFYRKSFTGTQGTAPDLWDVVFGTGTPTTTGCFGGAGNSITSLTNYNDIPAAWK